MLLPHLETHYEKCFPDAPADAQFWKDWDAVDDWLREELPFDGSRKLTQMETTKLLTLTRNKLSKVFKEAVARGKQP